MIIKKQKAHFKTYPCRRGCGSLLTTVSRSKWGIGELKKKYELICSNCLSRAEKNEMLAAMGQSIQLKVIEK